MEQDAPRLRMEVDLAMVITEKVPYAVSSLDHRFGFKNRLDPSAPITPLPQFGGEVLTGDRHGRIRAVMVDAGALPSLPDTQIN